MSGCSGYKHLKDGEKLLYNQKVQGNNHFDQYELRELFLQKENLRFPPYALIYQKGLKHFDTARFENRKRQVTQQYDQKIEEASREKKINKLTARRNKKVQKSDEKLREGNNFMQWGEPLAVYDPNAIEQTARNIQQYTFNRGYFKAKVNATTTFSGRGKKAGKKALVLYTLEEGRPYWIDTVFYSISDSTIHGILLKNEGTSFIKKDIVFRQRNLTSERERIEFLMKDHGFYNFSRQFVTFAMDTSWSDGYKIALQMSISNPSSGSHKQYVIDSVNFIINPSYKPVRPTPTVSAEQNGIVYTFYENIFSHRMLEQRVFISSDSLYSRSETLATQRQLANLDNFRFINVNYDSSGGRFIANIFTSPLDRYQWSHELGVNVTQGFPGPFYNLSFKKRNIFRGLENFEINGRFGIEGVATPGDVSQVYRSREYALNASLIVPNFVLPIGSNVKNRLGMNNPKTRFMVGIIDTDRFDYRRTNFNLSDIYTWQARNNALFRASLLDVSVINTRNISPTFRETLEKLNSRLINSFKPSFVSNVSFSAQKTTLEDIENPSSGSRFIRLLAESGGSVLNLFGTDYLTSQGLEYFKYYRLDFDYRRNHRLTSFSSYAYRINTGMAFPYGSNKSLPYEKYFFAGGSNGIRAWRPRRLGPGSFTPIDPETGQVSYDLEEQGEILIQASLEYRRHLIGFVDYALFIDIGNIWTINDDPSRADGAFHPLSFFKEIAVGTGLGLRFDFSFLIMRLDTGMKTYDPAREPGNRFILSPGFTNAPFDDPRKAEMLVFNIGIGYPF